MKRFLTNKGTSWKHIVERASWYGCTWERMVKSVKNCLKKNLGHSLLNLIELRTLLAEIQAVINDRPITFVYDDDEDITYPSRLQNFFMVVV